MKATRLEAFSDGVLAIIITIMVLELKVPPGVSIAALLEVLPVFLFYVFSFVFVAIYWVNHHHLLHLARHVDGPVLWFNMLLLFWLSLIPFATGYLGESFGLLKSAPLASRHAVALYAIVSLAAGIAFYFLRRTIARQSHDDPKVRSLHARMLRKNQVALAVYASAVVMAYVNVWVAMGLIVLPAAMYFMPDKQAEHVE